MQKYTNYCDWNTKAIKWKTHLHYKPELVFFLCLPRTQKQAMEGGDVGVHTEVSQNEILFLYFFDVIGHILQDFYSHPVTWTPSFTSVKTPDAL